MAKQSLELQVRGDLIQQRTDELVKYASESPNCRTMVTEIVETIGDSMIESIASSIGDVDEEEKKEMLLIVLIYFMDNNPFNNIASTSKIIRKE